MHLKIHSFLFFIEQTRIGTTVNVQVKSSHERLIYLFISLVFLQSSSVLCIERRRPDMGCVQEMLSACPFHLLSCQFPESPSCILFQPMWKKQRYFISMIDTNTKGNNKRKCLKLCLTNLWIHDTLLFEPTEIHVHGVDFAPQVAIVLTIISSSQVAETRCHVCSCRGKALN